MMAGNEGSAKEYPLAGCKGDDSDPVVCQDCLPGYQREGCRCTRPKRKYRVMCVIWYEEDANTGDEAKQIVESNQPGEFQYMRAERIS